MYAAHSDIHIAANSMVDTWSISSHVALMPGSTVLLRDWSQFTLVTLSIASCDGDDKSLSATMTLSAR